MKKDLPSSRIVGRDLTFKSRTPIEKTFKEVFRENLLPGIFLIWAVAGVALGMFKMCSAGPDITAEGAVQAQPLIPNKVMGEEQMREVLFSVPPPEPPSIHEQKVEQVNGHRARYDANPQDPQAEALLRAMGNLYKQTGDFPNAAWAYEQLLRRFPESTHKSAAYIELVGCYDQAKDPDNLARVYLEMLKVFPKDSNEFKFAEAGLKITHLDLKQRDPDARPQSGPEGTFDIQTLSDGSTRIVDSVPEPGSSPAGP